MELHNADRSGGERVRMRGGLNGGEGYPILVGLILATMEVEVLARWDSAEMRWGGRLVDPGGGVPD